MQYVLAHDLGSSGNKACLFNENGVLITSTFQDYDTFYPAPGWVEQSPQSWWEAIVRTTHELMAKVRIPPAEIACISFSATGLGCIPIDGNGQLVKKTTLLWSDGRAVKQAEQIRQDYGADRHYEKTGCGLRLENYPCSKIMWMKENEPDVFAAAHKFIGSKDFIIMKLTGVIATDFSDASGTGLLDIHLRKWDQELLQFVGIDREKLPDIYPSTHKAGGLTKSAAEELGLQQGTPVVMGGCDVPATGVGAGAVREGVLYNYIGSSAWISGATRKPLLDTVKHTYVFCHLVPDHYASQTATYSAGASYQWVLEKVCSHLLLPAAQAGVSVYELADLLANDVELGANDLFFLPSMMGGGTGCGNSNVLGAFVGLHPRHETRHFIRAAMEGVALELNSALNILKELGADPQEMRMVGGGAQSAFWRSIFANVYGMRVTRPRLLQEVAALGAAITGGVGVGLFASFDKIADLVGTDTFVDPTPQLIADYQKRYQLFTMAYQALKPMYDQLASL